jgi:hypothetical protein
MSSTETINPELNELFKAVNHEVTWLHKVWELLNQLYWSGAENFEIMEATAPHFFGILRTMLFEEMIMIVNRLTDPPITRGRTNASFERLIGLVDMQTHAELVESLHQRLKELRTNSGTFRAWRDKRVSHNDLSITLEKGNPLPHIMRGEAQRVVREIADFMNEFSLAILGQSQAYMPFLVADGDGSALMRYLKLARKAQEKEA